MIEKNKNISIINEDIKIKGNIYSKNELIVKGDISGTLKAESLTIAKGGKVAADITSATIIIGGDFQGEINAGKELTILSGGNCSGKITSKNIVIKKGAIVNASITQNIQTKLLEIKGVK
ncbi:MAG: polymer-forming cytoskeletal protein [Deltaproteobacteria bacterium]|nr:polymer-forming cytoskeletal protein [Deltaproteobacteria bacterium]